MEVEELSKRIERVANAAEQIAKRFEKEIGLDEELEWPFGLTLGLKAQRVVLATVKENVDLDDEILAYLALGATLGEFYNFAKLRVPRALPDAAVRVMKRLGYEFVEDQYELYFVEMLYRAGQRPADGVLSALGTTYVVFITPSDKIFAFKRV